MILEEIATTQRIMICNGVGSFIIFASLINFMEINASVKQVKKIIHLHFPLIGFSTLFYVPQVFISIYISLNAKFESKNQTSNL